MQLHCHLANEYETSVFYVIYSRRHLTNEMKNNGCRPKKHIFGSPVRTPGTITTKMRYAVSGTDLRL